YSAQYFSASGGSFTPPYSWSATGLPSGLNLTSAGILYGTPAQTGTNLVVTVTLTDTLSRTVQWNYPLNILSPTP
ncbi:MAG TPA: putative Ig domain-containing protein, partial [Candidatus Acidoferrum sp.]|nr:putative Ig domain-containing protein [Candidatus Acidoferrum sp.]